MVNNSRMEQRATTPNSQNTTEDKESHFARQFLKSKVIIDELTTAISNLNINEKQSEAKTNSKITYEGTLSMYGGKGSIININIKKCTNEPTNRKQHSTINGQANEENQTNMCVSTCLQNSPHYFEYSPSRTNRWSHFVKNYEENLTSSEKKAYNFCKSEINASLVTSRSISRNINLINSLSREAYNILDISAEKTPDQEDRKPITNH